MTVDSDLLIFLAFLGLIVFMAYLTVLALLDKRMRGKARRGMSEYGDVDLESPDAGHEPEIEEEEPIVGLERYEEPTPRRMPEPTADDEEEEELDLDNLFSKDVLKLAEESKEVKTPFSRRKLPSKGGDEVSYESKEVSLPSHVRKLTSLVGDEVSYDGEAYTPDLVDAGSSMRQKASPKRIEKVKTQPWPMEEKPSDATTVTRGPGLEPISTPSQKPAPHRATSREAKPEPKEFKYSVEKEISELDLEEKGRGIEEKQASARRDAHAPPVSPRREAPKWERKKTMAIPIPTVEKKDKHSLFRKKDKLSDEEMDQLLAVSYVDEYVDSDQLARDLKGEDIADKSTPKDAITVQIDKHRKRLYFGKGHIISEGGAPAKALEILAQCCEKLDGICYSKENKDDLCSKSPGLKKVSKKVTFRWFTEDASQSRSRGGNYNISFGDLDKIEQRIVSELRDGLCVYIEADSLLRTRMRNSPQDISNFINSLSKHIRDKRVVMLVFLTVTPQMDDSSSMLQNELAKTIVSSRIWQL